MQDNDFKELFVLACKYMQYNPPVTLNSAEEVQACLGSSTYEDGWKQWAMYFIQKYRKIQHEE